MENEKFYAHNGTLSRLNTSPDLPDDLVGGYVYAEDCWHRITGWTGSLHNGITLDPPLTNNGTITARFVTGNKIIVTPVSTMSLTKLNFVYKPTFA